MVNLTLLFLTLALCVASTVQRQLKLEEDINVHQNLEQQQDPSIVHYQPEQVHLAFGGMYLMNTVLVLHILFVKIVLSKQEIYL